MHVFIAVTSWFDFGLIFVFFAYFLLLVVSVVVTAST